MATPLLRLTVAGLIATFVASCSDSHSSSPGDGKNDPFGNGARGANNGNAGSGALGPTADDDAVTTPVHDDTGKLVPTTLPSFPGSGTSNAGLPLPNGMLCDAVAGVEVPIKERIETCFVDKNDESTGVAATLEQVLECVEEADTVHIRLTFHPWFVDNTYGANAIGWDKDGAVDPMMMPPAMDPMMMPPAMDPMMMPPAMDPMMMGKPPKMPKGGKGGHTFKDLVGSDHAEIILTDATGKEVMQFKLDYLSVDADKASGYGALGVLGGEGKVILGDPAHIVRWSTSMDLNLNDRGYASYLVDSPATDADYTPSSEAPEWDYRVVYEAWIDLDAFGAGGFGGATIEYVHASPAKADGNTIEVKKGKCPPCTDPDGCHDVPPPPDKPCGGNDPDNRCVDAGPPDNPGDPIDCKENPEQDGCHVE